MPLPPAVTIPTFIDFLLRSFHVQSSTQRGAPRNDWNWLADLCNVNSYRFGRLVMRSAGRPARSRECKSLTMKE